MTLPMLEAIRERWRVTPPLTVSLAAVARWCGAIERAPREWGADDAANDENLGELVASVMQGENTGIAVAETRPAWLVAGLELTEAEREKFAALRARRG